jgi:UDP-glucose 4-epimerase
MKVLITGGAGFIGSHLCDSFVARGEDVAILDNLSTGSKNNIAHLEGKIKVSQGDIRDQNLVESLVEDCDVIVHMAAALGVNNILENPIEAISTNFFGSEVILNSAVKYDKRIIIASTSEIYGKNPKQPLTEQDDRVVGTPQKLRWTYSDAKALEEAIAYSLFLTKNLKVITVRLFNTVGPRQTGKYGMVLPRFVDAALADKPIYVYGDGTQSRVFCHVYDAVNALQTLAYSQDCFGEVFNIGGNEVISILELAQKVAKMSKSKSEIMFVNYQDAYGPEYEDVQNRIPDINKIKTRINWKPIKTLENMIQDVIESIVRGI